MNKKEKALAKLSEKERSKVKSVFSKLSTNNLSGLDIKRLKNRPDVFRVRIGDLRIIYRSENGLANILAVSRRNEKTYK